MRRPAAAPAALTVLVVLGRCSFIFSAQGDVSQGGMGAASSDGFPEGGAREMASSIDDLLEHLTDLADGDVRPQNPSAGELGGGQRPDPRQNSALQQQGGALGDIAGAISNFFSGGDSDKDRCMAPSMEETLHVRVRECDAYGVRTVATTYHPSGHLGCQNNLVHPTPPPCTRECGEGQALLWHPQHHTFECQECPSGTFSIGGGRIQQRWPHGIPAQFETICFSLDPEKYAQGQQSWRERVDCQPWAANANGTALVSGNNSHFDYMESYLMLHLRFVRPGSLWFR